VVSRADHVPRSPSHVCGRRETSQQGQGGCAGCDRRKNGSQPLSPNTRSFSPISFRTQDLPKTVWSWKSVPVQMCRNPT